MNLIDKIIQSVTLLLFISLIVLLIGSAHNSFKEVADSKEEKKMMDNIFGDLYLTFELLIIIGTPLRHWIVNMVS